MILFIIYTNDNNFMYFSRCIYFTAGCRLLAFSCAAAGQGKSVGVAKTFQFLFEIRLEFII